MQFYQTDLTTGGLKEFFSKKEKEAQTPTPPGGPRNEKSPRSRGRAET